MLFERFKVELKYSIYFFIDDEIFFVAVGKSHTDSNRDHFVMD